MAEDIGLMLVEYGNEAYDLEKKWLNNPDVYKLTQDVSTNDSSEENYSPMKAFGTDLKRTTVKRSGVGNIDISQEMDQSYSMEF